MKISLLGCILPWREDACAKLQAFSEMDEELMMTLVELHALSSNLAKPVSKSPKKCGKKKARWFTLLQPTLPVKGNRGKVEAIGERIEGAVDLVIEADDGVYPTRQDHTNRYEQGVWSQGCRRKQTSS